VTLPGNLDAVGVVQAAAVNVEVTPPDVREPPPVPDGPPPDPITIPGDTRLVLDLAALPAIMKSPDGAGLRMSAAVAVLWRLLHSLEIRSVAGTVTLITTPPGFPAWRDGQTAELPVTWAEAPPTVPTGAVVSVQAGIAWLGRTTARVKPGSVTATGCVVLATAVGSTSVVPADNQPIIYSVQGLYLHTPALDMEQ
jgi:hypothetical protein